MYENATDHIGFRGMPLKIDPMSLTKMGLYSRVLEAVDCSPELPERVLVKRKSDGFEFYANLYYEFVPFYCQDAVSWPKGGEL